MEQIEGTALMAHVRALADRIGPRPAGHPQEEAARVYLEGQLAAAGIADVERLNFPTIDTWGWPLIVPVLLALAGGLIGTWPGTVGQIIGSAAALLGTSMLWQAVTGRIQYQPLYSLYPKRPGGTVLGRVPPAGEPRTRVVLIGHTDTNKHRLTFSPLFKQSMQLSASFMLLAAGVQVIATLLGIALLRDLLTLALIGSTVVLLLDERGEFVDGANDNATAVACTLGIGKQVVHTPLQHTELWLAFTGSEEVGHMGLNAVLDRYETELRDAWFIDFELVGSGRTSYVTRHSGLAYLTAYRPDADSLALAARTAESLPDLKVTGEEIVILEEVATLRRRGFRGLCLVALDETGWMPNWHQYSDTAANIDPAALERAAQFAWAMIQNIDRDAEGH